VGTEGTGPFHASVRAHTYTRCVTFEIFFKLACLWQENLAGRAGPTPVRPPGPRSTCLGPRPCQNRAGPLSFWPDPGPRGSGPGRPSGQVGQARPVDSVYPNSL